MSDYRERAERLAQETAQRKAAEDADRDTAFAEAERYLEERRRLVQETLDSIGVEEMLEDTNRSVWKSRGHIETTLEEDSWNNHIKGVYSLSAHEEEIVPDYEWVRRPGIITTQEWGPNPEGHGGGPYHKSFGMKVVGSKVVGTKDIGGNTVLSVEISFPLKIVPIGPSWPQGESRAVVTDREFDWSGDISSHLPDLPYGYTLTPYAGSATLGFPREDPDVDIIRRFADASILLASEARLRGVKRKLRDL